MENSESAHISLREVFTPLFSWVLFFTGSPAVGPQTFVDVRRAISHLLEEQKTLVKRGEIAPQDYDTARFAVVAWTDEAMLKGTFEANPEVYQQWKRAPLQAELYNTTNAGEEFFEKLAQLRPSQKEICEIYHLCLCLGFRGRYYDDEHEYKLLELRREHASHLPISFPDLFEIEKQKEQITPQPYEASAPTRRPPPQPSSPLWMVLTVTMLLVGFAYFLWPNSRCGNGVVDAGEQCDLSAATTACADGQICQADCSCPPPRPAPSSVALQEAVAPFECCDIQVVGVKNGVVTLAGHVQSEEQRQQVYEAVREVEYVTEVNDSFLLVPRPFCEVVQLLDPFKERSERSGSKLDIRLQNGCETIYYLGENIAAEVSATKPLQHLYIDYYAADRQFVAHLLPHPVQAENFFPDKTSFLSEGPGGEKWKIEEPLGAELITVISSPRPLFATRPPVKAEPAMAYIEELRGALTRDGTSNDITASYCFITSAKR